MRTVWFAGYSLLVVALFLVPVDLAEARAGYRGPSLSTWDARASSVVVGSTALAADDWVFSAHTYSTNFTSTSGNVSSQFGIHYLNLLGEERVDLNVEDERVPSAIHGVSAGAVTLIGRPLMERHENGIPRLAWGMYFGVVPSALIGIDRNYLDVPIVAGFGLPWSPRSWLSVTPWAEVAVSYSFDTFFVPEQVDLALLEGEEETSIEDVVDVLSSALVLEYGGSVTGRAGVAVSSYLGERLDINLGFTLASLANSEGNAFAFGGNASVTFHWDHVVTAVLPE